MRKIIFSIVIFLIIVLVLGPFTAGILIQKKYRDLISFYNFQENIHINIVSYQRGWLSSDVVLTLTVNPKYLENFFQDADDSTIPYKIIIKQHIQHGPILYRHVENLPDILGLAVLQNKIIIPPEINMPDVKIQSVSFASFLGNYFNYLQISGLSFSDDADGIKNITMKFWIYPTERRFNGSVRLTQFADKQVGFINVDMSFDKFNVSAMRRLLDVYQEIIEHGEIYQGQLKQKISLLLPTIVNAGSSIHLSEFDLSMPNGKIVANGVLEWPENNFLPPSHLRDLLMSAMAQLNLKVSKNLLPDLIQLAATMPDFVRDVAKPERNLLIDARNEMEFAGQRNLLFIGYFSDRGYISKQAEDILLDAQKNLIPLNEYIQAVKNLFLDRQISLVVSYQLCWQYAQIQKPYRFLTDRVVAYQQIAAKQLREQFDRLLKKGYVNESNADYVAILKWSDGRFTSNNYDIK